MERAFGYISITTTSTAQPLIFTALSAAVIAPTTKPDSSQLTSIPVSSSAIFVAKDYVTLMSLTGTNQERLIIESIIDSTHIQVKGMTLARLSTDLAVLSVPVCIATVQALDGNTAALGLGTGPTANLTTGAGLIYKMATVAASSQSQMFSTRLSGTNSQNSSDLWIVGTSGDKYLPSVAIL